MDRDRVCYHVYMSQKPTTTYQWNKNVEALLDKAAQHVDRAFGPEEK